MNVESGDIQINSEKDLKDLLKFFREAVEKDTLNKSIRDMLLKGVDEIEKKYFNLFNENEDLINRLDWCIDNLSGVKLKDYAKLRSFKK